MDKRRIPAPSAARPPSRRQCLLRRPVDRPLREISNSNAIWVLSFPPLGLSASCPVCSTYGVTSSNPAEDTNRKKKPQLLLTTGLHCYDRCCAVSFLPFSFSFFLCRCSVFVFEFICPLPIYHRGHRCLPVWSTPKENPWTGMDSNEGGPWKHRMAGILLCCLLLYHCIVSCFVLCARAVFLGPAG